MRLVPVLVLAAGAVSAEVAHAAVDLGERHKFYAFRIKANENISYLVIRPLDGGVVVQAALALEAGEALLVVPRALGDHLLGLKHLWRQQFVQTLFNL